MAKGNVALQAFNRGIVSPLALARTDIDRLAFSAETMTNWMSRVMGSMMLRPGLEYIGETNKNSAAKFIPFVFSTDDIALCELTTGYLRVWIDETVLTRPSVSSAVTNGQFWPDLANWTDDDESGATSSWVFDHNYIILLDPVPGGNMQLLGNGTAHAIRTQEVTVASADQGVEHALSISIGRPESSIAPPSYPAYTTAMPGSVRLRVGSTDGDDDYIATTWLEEGEHSLAFTPTGNFWIQFASKEKYPVFVSSCEVGSSGAVNLLTGITDLDSVRYDQSGDIIFIAHTGRQVKIERRAARSWSVVKYYALDGPFKVENTLTTTLTPSALTGDITLTSSDGDFASNKIGQLYKITSVGQQVTASATAEDTFTESIEVTGVAGQRIFDVSIIGTFTVTATLQKTTDLVSGSWVDVKTWVGSTIITETYDDGLDNQIIYYRIGVDTGDYTTGTAIMTLTYAEGSVTGIVMLTSDKDLIKGAATATVLKSLGGTAATDIWSEGEWSTADGFPSSVAFAEGRLWWAGKNGVWGSVSDAYYSFDDATVGDSGPIARTIGSGPVDTINWIASLQRLVLGAEGAEFICKSSSFDEPLTPTAFSIRPISSQGSAAVDVVRVDKEGMFIQRGGTRLMKITQGGDGEYESLDLTILTPEVTQPNVVRIGVQRQPDTRIHCVRSDGKVAILVFDRAEEVISWQLFETDGTVEDVVVLPGQVGDTEDTVYYVVNRTINGSTVRYLEKWAFESECEGGTTNKQADCFLAYSGVSTTAMTGLSHLEGETVVVWGDGKDLGSYTVSSGAITLSEAVSEAIIGLTYTAQWKSSKLAYAARLGTALSQTKRINHLGVILLNTHYQGLEYGTDFTTMDNLPLMKDATAIAADTVHANFDQQAFEFPGHWDADTRLCLQATAPRPCNIAAAILGIDTNEKY